MSHIETPKPHSMRSRRFDHCADADGNDAAISTSCGERGAGPGSTGDSLYQRSQSRRSTYRPRSGGADVAVIDTREDKANVTKPDVSGRHSLGAPRVHVEY